jgi:hypothetical protein
MSETGPLGPGVIIPTRAAENLLAQPAALTHEDMIRNGRISLALKRVGRGGEHRALSDDASCRLTTKLSGRPTRLNRRRESDNVFALAPLPPTVHGPLRRTLVRAPEFLAQDAT